MPRLTIGNKNWRDGDRTRISNVREKPVSHKPPEDVTTTYGHVFWHDVNYAKSIKPRVSAYVDGHRERDYLLDDRKYWDEVSERLRLVKKDDAEHSAIASGIDDLWLEDYGDPVYIVLTNYRTGKRQIRFLMNKEFLPLLEEKLGIFPIQMTGNEEV